MRNRLLVGALIILVLATSCGNPSSDAGNVSLESARDSNEQVQPTPTDADNNRLSSDDLEPKTVLNLEDMLVYTTDFSLYVWDFNTEEQPQTFDFFMGGEQIYLAPSENYIVFGGIKSDIFGLYRLDLQTREISLIVDVTNRPFIPNWSILSWSPDQKWLIINARNIGTPLGFVRADGSSNSVHELADAWKPTYWTVDNQIILTEIDDQFRSSERLFLPIESVTQIDPATDTRADLTSQLDMDFINEAHDYLEQGQRLAEALHTLDIELDAASLDSSVEIPNQTVWVDVNYPDNLGEDGLTGAALYCNTWQIAEWDLGQGLATEPVRILREFENTAGLMNLTRLEDGSILFIYIWYPDCAYGTPQGQLIHMQPDGEYDVISENIVSAGDTSAFRGFLDGTRFIVSPNQQVVLWFHQGINGSPEEKTVYVTDLKTGESNPLLVDGESLHSIVRILWVARE